MTELATLPTAAPIHTPIHAPTHAPAQAKAPRLDLYVHIHKALRLFMSRTLERLGRMDASDAEDRAGTLEQVQSLLTMMRSHLQHENDFIHTAIEARRPGHSRHTADDHLLHLDAIGNLEDEVHAVADAREELRAVRALRLYRHLAEFVGENLAHMQVEETQNNATLWELYSDAELEALHDRLLASVPPAEMALVVGWMAAALNPQELAGLCAGMQGKAPPPVFEAMLEIVRSRLDDARWAHLARALGRPPVPGLVTV